MGYKKMAALLGMVSMSGADFGMKIKNTRENKWQKHYTPPRSMTPEEQAYYAKHKNLNHFHKL